MNCKFCNQFCKRIGPYGTWHLCQSCKVFFHESKQEIIFRPNSPTHWYWLCVNLDEDTTVVECQRDPKSMSIEDQIDMDPMAMPKRLLTIKPAMQGVTPQNMHDKLKTLLIFS